MTTPTRQQGFGLVEIMVAITLGLLLTAAMVRMVLDTKENYTYSNTVARLQENGRFGMDMLTADIRRAGYLGLNNKVRDDAGKLIIGGTLGPQATDIKCKTGGSQWARQIERPLFGKNDNRSNYACIPAADYLRGDILVTRYANADPIGTDGAAFPGKAYLDSAIYLRAGTMDGKIFRGSDRDDAINDMLEAPTADYLLVANAYYLSTTNRSCQGEPIPALFRETLNNAGKPGGEELLAGVEQMQFQYGVDGRYYNGWNAMDWSAVDSVKIWLLVRSECPELGFRDTNTYTMANITFTPDPDTIESRFRRRLYTTVVSIRNPL